MSVSVSVEAVSKRFRLVHESSTIKGRLVRGRRSASEELWALDDVTFGVRQGEAVGLLGHNGSGKSTLLRCVAGILRPTKGRIRTAGRVAALLELGSGFHPELTGRQNVYLNASILGLTRAEVDRRFAAIVDFAELHQFMDVQVKQYSSGMHARLAFAVAVSVEPDILLVDEVLAVGDEAFQAKCIDRIIEFRRQGRTIMVVSHAASLVRDICDRTVVLDEGRLVTEADVDGGIRMLRRTLARRSPGHVPRPPEDEDPSLEDVVLIYPWGRDHLAPGEPLEVEVEVGAQVETSDVVVGLGVYDLHDNELLVTDTDGLETDVHLTAGRTTLRFRFAAIPLRAGEFQLVITLSSHDGHIQYDCRDGIDRFEVKGTSSSAGLVHFPLTVELGPTLPSTEPLSATKWTQPNLGSTPT